MFEICRVLVTFAISLVVGYIVQAFLVLRCGMPVEQAGGVATIAVITTGFYLCRLKIGSK